MLVGFLSSLKRGVSCNVSCDVANVLKVPFVSAPLLVTYQVSEYTTGRTALLAKHRIQKTEGGTE